MLRPARGIAALSAALVLVACSQTPEVTVVEAKGSPLRAEFPVTIEASNGPVEITERPDRIVSLSATATEMLFAIDAGPQVVAVDDTSNYPPEAPTTELSAYEPNVEAIVEFDPDLVVVSDDINELVASLETLGIAALVEPAAEDLGDTYDQIEDLGMATGHPSEARRLVGSMTVGLENALINIAPGSEDVPTYYYELDPTLFTATSNTFIGELYSLLGLRNIADPADKDGTGYPQLSAEYIVKADPDLIFLADTKCCGESAETVADRPGWERISAVKTGAVIELDDDIASRWGPRVVELLQIAASAVEGLEAV